MHTTTTRRHADARPRRTLKLVAQISALALAASSLALAGALPANAAPGDYDVSVTAPGSVPVRSAYTYTVQVTADAGPDSPAPGIVLTAVLPAGVGFDSVPTGAGSPVASAVVSGSTVTFTLKPLVESLSTFVFSVSQNANGAKNEGTVFPLTITGTADSGGPVASNTATTAVTGDFDYFPSKGVTTVLGSDNRTLNYTFNVSTNDASAASDTFTAAAQRLTDTLPAGAYVVSQNAGIGAWVLTPASADVTPTTVQTAVWTNTSAYGPSGLGVTSGTTGISLNVYYPAGVFPTTGTSRPPVNTVGLEVQGSNTTWHTRGTATTQGPVFGPTGEISETFLTKTATANAQPGFLADSYSVVGSYVDTSNTPLDRLVVSDSSQDSAANAAYWSHLDVLGLGVSFNPTLKAANLPYTVEYQTNLAPAYREIPVYSVAHTTGSDLSLGVQRAGSQGYTTPPAYEHLDLVPGELLTGWRVVLSPGTADAAVPALSQVTVGISFQSLYRSNVDASTSAAALLNTATIRGVQPGGVPLPVKTASDDTTFLNGVYVTTNITANATSFNVGSNASYTAGIVNQNPQDTYTDSKLDIVLPFGVQYNPAVGVSRILATLPEGSIPVPNIGDGVTVTTGFVTDPTTLQQLQVVTLTFASLPPMRGEGAVSNRYEENRGFQYNIPVTVLAQAYSPTNSTARARSYTHTDDPAYTAVPNRGYGPFFGGDTFDFDTNRTNIAASSSTVQVTAAGGLLLGELVSPGSPSYALSTVVDSPGVGSWQVYVSNSLPGTVTAVTLFDRLPYTGDAAGSQYTTVLTGPVTGLPAGASVEYSTDATSATTGTWTGNPVGATAFRVLLPSIASGQAMELNAPFSVPGGLAAGATAVNSATATATYSGITHQFASNSARAVVAAAPSISVVKTTNGLDVTAAPGPSLLTGSPVAWGYAVTNTGNTALADVAVSDDIEGAATAPAGFDGTLAPGATALFTATAAAASGLYTNVATATGQPAEGDAVTATDQSWYTGIDPALSLEKTTNGEVYDSAPGAYIADGGVVVWGYLLTNNGDAALTGIALTDDQEGVIAAPAGFDGTLEPGESVSYSAVGSAGLGDYRNEAAATASAGGNEVVSNTAVSYYTGYTTGLAVVKRTNGVEYSAAPGALVTVGDTVTWTYEVTNTGSLPVFPSLSDDREGELLAPEGFDGVLAPGETVVYTLVGIAVLGQYSNVVSASAVALDSDGEPLAGIEAASASDTSWYLASALPVQTAIISLAHTGAELGAPVLVAALLLLVGAALALARIRRRA